MRTIPAGQTPRVSRSVSALRAWHDLSVDDLADAMRVSTATAQRRFKDGGYKYAEVQALAEFFSVTIGDLESGEVSLVGSSLPSGYEQRNSAIATKRPRRDSNPRHTAYNSTPSVREHDLVAA